LFAFVLGQNDLLLPFATNLLPELLPPRIGKLKALLQLLALYSMLIAEAAVVISPQSLASEFSLELEGFVVLVAVGQLLLECFDLGGQFDLVEVGLLDLLLECGDGLLLG
jgi:hypothetical protein